MALRNAGKTIREARLKSGLTQEKMSDGICSALTLSRIENNADGVSPSLFKALMSRTGNPEEVYPVFADFQDFDCFYTLKRSRLYLNSWQLSLSYNELEKIKSINFANNKFYYQEWLYLISQIQYRSGSSDHMSIYNILIKALHITRPDINLKSIENLFLTNIEIEILIALSHECLYLKDYDTVSVLCSQLLEYINNAYLSFLEQEHFIVCHSIVYTKYLIYLKKYKGALEIINNSRRKAIFNNENEHLLELTFWTAISYFFCGDKKNAKKYFNTTFYSSYSIASCYATQCLNFTRQYTDIPIDPYINSLAPISYHFNTLEYFVPDTLSEGTYDLFSLDIMTIGHIIQTFRKEQHLSQSTLCYGLCTKSTLSKIENGHLQPDYFLSEALLERLGISEREFIFWGNQSQELIFDLNNKYKTLHNLSYNEKCKLLDEFQKMINTNCNNIFILQKYYHLQSYTLIDANDKIPVLENALNYTLPDFNIYNIQNYRLSNVELAILADIAYTCQINDIYKSNLYFSKIIEYFSTAKLDFIFKSLIVPITISKYSQILFIQKRFDELINLFSPEIISIMKIHTDDYSFFFLYLCQAFCEKNDYTQATSYGYYAMYLQRLWDLNENSITIQNGLFDEYNLKLV